MNQYPQPSTSGHQAHSEISALLHDLEDDDDDSWIK